MRKLKLQMNITTDGFVAGPNGELDWMSTSMEGPQLKILTAITESIDTIVMGRGMVREFTEYWENVVDNQPESPEYKFAKIFVDTPKVVFSRSAKNLPGRNVRVENGTLAEKINELKKQKGKDIIVYGGATFVSSLLEEKLIDDLYLFINPVALGAGRAIFRNRAELKVISSELFPNGIIANHYQQK